MVAHGRVRNGVVVVDDGTLLPEGEEVTVLVLAQAPQHLLPESPEEGGRAKAGETAGAAASPTHELQSHSLLDIAPVSLHSVLRPIESDDDLLGEMLDERL